MAKHFNYRFSFQHPSLKEPQNECSPKRANESGSYPFNTTAVTQNNKRSSNYLNVLTLKSVTVISFPTDSFAQNSQWVRQLSYTSEPVVLCYLGKRFTNVNCCISPENYQRLKLLYELPQIFLSWDKNEEKKRFERQLAEFQIILKWRKAALRRYHIKKRSRRSFKSNHVGFSLNRKNSVAF